HCIYCQRQRRKGHRVISRILRGKQGKKTLCGASRIMKKEFNCKKSRIHKCAAFALAMVLSVTSILFTTYQNLTIKELSAAINRTQESINNATALVPDTRETSFFIDAGNSI